MVIITFNGEVYICMDTEMTIYGANVLGLYLNKINFIMFLHI